MDLSVWIECCLSLIRKVLERPCRRRVRELPVEASVGYTERESEGKRDREQQAHTAHTRRDTVTRKIDNREMVDRLTITQKL